MRKDFFFEADDLEVILFGLAAAFLTTGAAFFATGFFAVFEGFFAGFAMLNSYCGLLPTTSRRQLGN
jgi:hypothetical protein